eukprot:CAMPEP_0202689316 /NCGR_PEP_ID=MMETSP1385-20130828/4606_1 /ASSEMBLY_ACC=CAM_ASM_000861 /TAXON_ID=933848 /ORGANISM="Elphidium margaritaceum" /LENGTH=904 /DNA_ID=CAMNT_0049344437 /DNA_START=53 /DNA_END=2764 /DNA_ORIENTATION=+
MTSLRGYSTGVRNSGAVMQDQDHKQSESGGQSDRSETHKNSSPRVTQAIKPKQFNEKAMKQWTTDDVKCWISSMEQFAGYAKQFYIDGQELQLITKDELASIIPKKLWRRKLMEQIELAKEKFSEAAVAKDNNDDGDGDGGDEADSPETQSNEDTSSTTRAPPQVVGVIGLSNQGNTCYMNTSIQILSQTPNLTGFLKTRARLQQQKQKQKQKPKSSSKYAMLEAWTSLCDVLYNPSSTKRHYDRWTPYGIKNALKSIDSDFGSGQQDDAARCFSFMLQALDDDIHGELADKTKSPSARVAVRGSSSIEVYGEQAQLAADQQRNCVHKLLRRYNPSETVVKNTFTGVERVSYECLECGHFCHQFVPLRVLKLAVVSHEIEIENITAVLLHEIKVVPSVRVLDYCSVNALKYAVAQKLQLAMNVDAVLQLKVLLRPNDAHGRMEEIDDESKISTVLARCAGGKASVWVAQSGASPTSRTSHIRSSCVVFIVSMTSVSSSVSSVSSVSVQYFDQCTTQQISALLRSYTSTTGSYFVKLNGHYLQNYNIVLSADFVGFKQHGLNELVVVSMCGPSLPNRMDADIEDTRILVEALLRFPRKQRDQALQQQLRLWQNMNAPLHIQQRVDQKIKALTALQTKFQQIDNISRTVRSGIASTFQTKTTSSSNILLLGNLLQCLAEYQKPAVLDESAYSYLCRHCNRGRPASFVCMTKTIVHCPVVFVFHLDRFGRDSRTTYDTKHRSCTSTSTCSSPPSSFYVGQKIQAKYSNGNFYRATITRLADNGKVIDIAYDDDQIQDKIYARDYATRLIVDDEGPTSSQSRRTSYNSYSYSTSSWRSNSNKFDHAIDYEHSLSFNNNATKYGLYGISNHCGSTTKGGHYTATVKCLSDGQWYSISDSWVRPSSQQSA